MRQCRVFVALIAVLLTAAVPLSALASCLADHSRPAMAQMACCKKAKPDCGTASSGTMECCKAGNHPEQQIVAKIQKIANPLRPIFLSTPSTLAQQPRIPRPSPDPVTLFAGTTSPPRFSFSALLI